MMRFFPPVNYKLVGIYILLCLAFAVMLSTRQVQAAGLQVNSANDNDDGTCNALHCSLHEAINAANALDGLDIITFNISGGGVQTIQPITTLPTITSPVIIDGTTQPGYAVGVPVIELDGTNAGASADGLVLLGGGITVRGLVINRFKSNGILIATTGGNTIVGNFIGTDATGTLARPNGQIAGGPTTGNGIYVDVSAPGNIIGGVTTAERNLISGNSFQVGIMLASSGNVVRGNFIGTNAAGTDDLGNGFGIRIAQNTNTIGGTTSGAGNIISGNQAAALDINGSGNTIQGNYIGTDITGTLDLGNGFIGISIMGDGFNASANNLIGGTDPGAGNIIAYNAVVGPGIGINGTTSTVGNAILGNSIFDNGSLGIDIGPEGFTANDVGDADIGVNNRQNFPVLSSVYWVGGDLHISAALNSTANILFRIEFFVSPACDTGGNGEGQTYLGFTSATTDATGNISFTADLPVGGVSPAQVITATATDPANNTSEFSGCAVIPALPPPAQSGPTFIVNTAADVDDGVCGIAICSLRETINVANELPDSNTIRFEISAGGLQTIQPTSELPAIMSPVIIDGTTQPGFAGVPLIELDGTNAGTSARGLTIAGGNSTIKGLIINRFALSGIWLTVGGSNVVTGNYLGTDSTGTQARGNRDGITITESANNQIGGLTAAHRNIISGNTDDGINLYDGPTMGTVIQSNYIGTDVNGQVALGNADSGIEFDSISDALIGGTTSSTRNIISGNKYGIFFNDGGTEVLIQGNYIGTNVAGTAAIPNETGIWLLNGGNNQIGGVTAAARNIISGNTTGIILRDTNNRVQGNYIGVSPDGISPLGNTGSGIEVDTFSIAVAPENVIGGLVTGTGNLIAYNGSYGITSNASPLSVKPFAVLGNSIFSNGGLGIDLAGDGITANDLGDGDNGANGLQNFPVLSSGGPFGSGTTINGVLNSQPTTTYHVEFFTNTTCDASGNGEGQTYLGFANATTNGSGDVNFTANLSAVTSSGQFITATTTDPNNNTSEFSACVPVVAISAPAAAPNRSYFTTPSVSLSWSAVTYATGYIVQWDDNDVFSSPSEVSRSADEFLTDITVSNDGVYYWRVRATNTAATMTPWSAIQSFTVDVP